MIWIGGMIVQFTSNEYYGGMDQLSSHQVIEPMMSEDEEAVGDALSFGTADLGTTTNPMGNALESVKSRIMEGAGKLEFEFIGKGKGTSQQPTPESYGSEERRDMKELLTINDIKSSVHASVHNESLAGIGQGGFSGAQREEALREVKRAINFAGDVTDGGAIVFHLSEWQRPMTYAGKRTLQNEKQWMFKGYDTEDKDTQLLVVDKRTGKFIEGIQKDKEVYEPIYKTVGKDLPDMVGKVVDVKDEQDNVVKHQVSADDWVTVDGKVIPRHTNNVSVLFERVPEWNPEGMNFSVQRLTWDNFVKRAEEWNKTHPANEVTPEELYARTELENRVLQFKGSSLYHAQMYEMHQRQQRKLREALKLYEAYEGDLPPEERDRLRQLVDERYGVQSRSFLRGDWKLPTEMIKEDIKDAENHMRHIHESSAAADAQAKQYEDMIKNMQTAENYGLEKTAESIAKIGLMAREETKRKRLSQPLYAAPENWDQHVYGSHPEEMRRVVEESRKQMAEQLLREHKVSSKEQGLKEAQNHIQATLDIGHMNMWRQYFNPLDEHGNEKYKTAEEREKAFEKWMLNETEKLVKDGVVGHLHLTDNYGYGDEHLTPGQGNVPMKEFMKRMEKLGMRDMTVEPGSFNITTALPDTMRLVGSPVYGVGRLPRFNQVQHQHFGYNAPPFFIAGAYVPSNDWRPWTEVPLE
ncbi:hypothetical protein GF367_01380 [Candidatus Woesearchaeota archaeon]|nr:hypothetical protein [Candidatus Woesearchaeota archaeon]